MAKTKRKRQKAQQQRGISTKQIILALNVFKANATLKQEPPLTGLLLASAENNLKAAIAELVKACNYEQAQYTEALEIARLVIEERAKELEGEQEAKAHGAYLE